MDKDLTATFITSPNIALVKYWGKYNQQHILPINDSISLTLDSQDLKTTTTLTFSSSLPSDCLLLNNQPTPIPARICRMLQTARQQSSQPSWKFQIVSTNSFPTASGMASSASGLAALALCLKRMFGGQFESVSRAARLGSGSASRSIYGGLVRWTGVPQAVLREGSSEEQVERLSEECVAEQLLSEEKMDWLRVIILLAGSQKKETSSTQGMKTSVQTSTLIQLRNQIAKERIKTILHSIDTKDMNLFSETIIKDSNQFHAICLDTYPPVFYLNEFSKSVIQIVDRRLNKVLKHKIAYTFDAGPHAFLIVHADVFEETFAYLLRIYEPTEEQLNERARNCKKNIKMGKELEEEVFVPEYRPSAIWVTKVGKGPIDVSN